VWYFAAYPIVLLGDDTDAPTPPQIEKYGRLKLPPVAKNLGARLEGFQDHILWVRFNMAPADEAVFWTSTKCSTALSVESTAVAKYKEIEQGMNATTNPPWWKPLPLTDFTARSAGGSFSQVIIIDKKNPKEFIVYICYFEI
jgi:hypothetical protein